jgi:hypothetical protein
MKNSLARKVYLKESYISLMGYFRNEGKNVTLDQDFVLGTVGEQSYFLGDGFIFLILSLIWLHTSCSCYMCFKFDKHINYFLSVDAYMV